MAKITIVGDKTNTSYNLDSISSSFSVDSLKIRIPLSLVNYKEGLLGDKYLVVSDRHGDVVDDFKKDAYFKEYEGIKTYYRLEKQYTSQGRVDDFLTILLTSKLCKADYFSGINQNTINYVYEELISHNVVSFSYDSFMKAECTDTDFKFDLIPSRPAKEIIQVLENNVIPRKQACNGAMVYKRKENLGIQFAMRKTPNFNKYPYLKFYEKIRELTYKSNDFFAHHIVPFSISDPLPKELLRVETTVKNKKHFKKLGHNYTNLNYVITNTSNIAKDAFQKAFSAHLPNYNGLHAPVAPSDKKLSPTDKILIHAIEDKIIEGNSVLKSIDILLKVSCVGKQQRYRMRKRLMELKEHIDFKSKIAPDTMDFVAWFSELENRVIY